MAFPISGLDCLDPHEQYLFNLYGRGLSQGCPFPTVHAAFLHHAAKEPLAIAIRDKSSKPERTITYRDLAQHAAFVARQLIDLGVEVDQKIPIVTRRSIEMVVGILAVLMAGGQYVPLDGSVVPDKTLDFVFQSCGDNSPVLATAPTVERVGQHARGRKVLQIEKSMDAARACWSDLAPFTIPNLAQGCNGCYVIYTSGTTGVPKGVDVLHSNVTNLLCCAPGNVGMSPGATVGSVLSISFDMGAWEILGAMCNGCTLVMRGSDWRETLRELDVLICTPTILAGYTPDDLPRLKFVATAGERLPQNTADLWSKAGKVFFTGCGPTEVTIVNTLHVHTPDQPVAIGRPVPNTSVYILDEDDRPVSIGKLGILWAGGACVSRGYINLPEKTAARWKPDPFAADGSSMFNTGDLGCWLPNGTLQIMGRWDDQVKVKGFRVELDGVSASLASCPGVEAAVAILCSGKICGFVTPATTVIEDVLASMRTKLPYYAVPEACLAIQDFPKTVNGKIDKRALTDLAQQLSSPAAPRTAIISSRNSSEATEVSTSSSKTASVTGIPISEKAVAMSKPTSVQSTQLLEVPAKTRHRWIRLTRLRAFIVYRTIFSVVWLTNIAALLCVIILRPEPLWISRIAYINLTVGVLMRQDHVVNLMYTMVCSLPRSWPLFLRRRAAKVYHFGGMHSGSATAAVAWYVGSLIVNTSRRVNDTDSLHQQSSLANLVVSWLTVGLLFAIIGAAYPTFRKAHHDKFELVHRLLGWTALALIWASTVISVSDNHRHSINSRTGSSRSLGTAIASSPEFWLVVIITGSIALSWATLRKVAVESEVLSSHAVRLHFDYAVPVNGCFVRLSHSPLLEWHSFATIGAPEPVDGHPRGFSLIVSNAGNWTKDVIDRPRSSMWVRGVPTCGVMRITTLFNSLVIISTGSGIGPQLGFIQRPTCRYRLIWSTKDPEKTYGSNVCAAIRKGDPQAIIWDTSASGRPDLVKMAWEEYQRIEAEAVLIISNEKLTKKVVYGLESRGVPAFGAIWDS